MDERLNNNTLSGSSMLPKPPEVKIGEFPQSRIRYKTDGLPYEEKPPFSNSPISFEEMTSALYEDYVELYKHAAIYNRFSEKYLESSRLLDRMVSYLGRCAVTQAAFEKLGYHFEHLQDDLIMQLYCCVSFNFRKTHDAIQKTTIKNRPFWYQMLEMECNWYNQAQRLKATEQKIRDIRSGKVSVESILRGHPAAKAKSDKNRSEGSGKGRAMTKAPVHAVYKEALKAGAEAAAAEKAEPVSKPQTAAAPKTASLPAPSSAPMPGFMPGQKQQPEWFTNVLNEYRKKAETVARQKAAEAARSEHYLEEKSPAPVLSMKKGSRKKEKRRKH